MPNLSVHADQAAPLGRAFTDQSDLIELYLLRFDRPNTRRAYERDLESFFGSQVVTLEMAREVTFPHVNAFISSLEDQNKSPATIRRRVTAVRGLFAWLVALGFLELNPADRQLVRRVALDRPQDRVLTVLTKQQARQLVDSVDLSRETGPRDQALLLTLLHCVLRRSEAAAMDFEHIRRAGEHWILVLPRTKGGANQTVKMPPTIAMTLQGLRSVYGYTSGPLWRSFSRNSKGKRLSGTSIYNIVSSHAKKAGIKDTVGAHTLRHTGCTLAIEAGASVQQVQTHARHKNLETTMLYVHQRDRLADSAADYIDF
ncbi:MAG: tyrosine-type recombinase/integrase [Bacteroidota bacterium]